MTRLRVGTAGFAADPVGHWESLDAIELKAGALGPSPLSAAQRVRDNAPDGTFIALRAPKLITHGPPQSRRRRGPHALHDEADAPFADTRDTRRRWKDTIEICGALAAQLIVLPCPVSFAPSPESIDRLCAFCDWAHRSGLHLGLQVRHIAWEDDAIWRLCRELSLTHVVDPLVRPCMRPRPAYFRMTGLGAERAYTDDDLVRLAVICRATTAPTERFRSVNCVFSTATAARDAARFVKIEEGSNHRARRGHGG